MLPHFSAILTQAREREQRVKEDGLSPGRPAIKHPWENRHMASSTGWQLRIGCDQQSFPGRV